MAPKSGTSSRRYRVEITQPAEKQLNALARKLGNPLFEQVAGAIRELESDPESKSQPLSGKLSPYRSLHVNRCRIIIKIIDATVTVYVVAAGWHTSGHRSDVYAEFQRMLERNKTDATPSAKPRARPSPKQ